MSIFFFCDFKPLLGSIYLIAFFLIHQSSSIHNIISKWIMIYRFWLKGNSTDFTCWKCYNYPQCNWVITGGNFFRLHAASCWDTKKSLAVFFPTYAVVLTSRLKWAPPFHVHVNKCCWSFSVIQVFWSECCIVGNWTCFSFFFEETETSTVAYDSALRLTLVNQYPDITEYFYALILILLVR